VPASETASTPESRALPAFPALEFRLPDEAPVGVRTDGSFRQSRIPSPGFVNLILLDLIRDTSCLQPHWEQLSHE